MLSLRLTVASLLTIFAVGCGSGSSPSPTAPTPTPSPTPGGPSSSVTILKGAEFLGNQAFAPDDLNVAVGTTVTWTNTDSTSHTSTSDASGWQSGIIAPGGHFSFSFPTAGTFRYHCSIHPGMVGTVVVK
jgi:plastocyanin